MTLPDLDAARAVADAVLYEGYLLYPYRASSQKNQVRWQFGVLVPPAWAATGNSEPTGLRSECVFEPRDGAGLHLVLRFLQVHARTVEKFTDSGYQPVDKLVVDDSELLTFDEAVAREVSVELPVDELRDTEKRQSIDLPGGEHIEPVTDEGRPVGRIVRRSQPLAAVLTATVTPLPGPYGAMRLSLRVENVSDWAAVAGAAGPPEAAGREEALRHALVSAHLLIGLERGRFLSMLDPPEWARPAVQECRNEHCWPVLVGADGPRDVMLASPIILYDHPTIAPESPGDLFDSTEIDEILTLRTMALTDEEKREARATDPKAAAIIERSDTMPPEVLDRLHGAVRYLRSITGAGVQLPDSVPPDVAVPGALPPGAQPTGTEPGSGAGPGRDDDLAAAAMAAAKLPWWDPGVDSSVSPETDTIVIGTALVGKGSRVRLRPGMRRTDAQDLFRAGRTATVQGVFHDVDGGRHLAVTIDDDPAAELLDWQGRYLYFAPDEVEPLEHEPSAREPLVHEPSAREPLVHEPSAREPLVHEPSVREPLSRESLSREPSEESG